MELSEYLGMVVQQAAMDLVAKGITEPTDDQLREAFEARCLRNHELCKAGVDGSWYGRAKRDMIREHLAAQTYRALQAMVVYHDSKFTQNREAAIEMAEKALAAEKRARNESL